MILLEDTSDFVFDAFNEKSHAMIAQPMLILKYLKAHINKETVIETKDHGTITGKITSIDKHMNVTIENAVVCGNKTKKIHLRGSRLRNFLL